MDGLTHKPVTWDLAVDCALSQARYNVAWKALAYGSTLLRA